MFSALGKAAVHHCLAFADLYERQSNMGVTVVAQGCCQLVLQSSSMPESILSALGKSAVHHCWAIADLHEGQSNMGVTVVAQGSCQLF